MLFNELARIWSRVECFESTLVDFQVFRLARGFEPLAALHHRVRR